MAEDNKEKPLTVQDIYETLIPAMKEVFYTRQEFSEFKNKVLSGQDKILKDLEILMTEKEMGYYQKQKERKLWQIMIEAMRKNNILSAEQIEEINGLEVF